MIDLSLSLDDILPPEPEPAVHGGCGRCGSGEAAERCGNGLEEIYPTTAVRFGYMKFIGEFSYPKDMKFTCGAKVVIQTRRGIEIGAQVSLSCSGCDRSITRDQIKDWVDTCGEDSFIFDAGRILREATAADLAEYARIQAGCYAKRNFCQKVAERLELQLKVVECECPFGGERIIFYFRADERVDFRSMVKELASEFRTRIEMRQVGARDEARLLADFETCGREVCCKAFLKTLRPISMKMAKLQKATLDPSKVSGRCGRLKCCLRYEHPTYEELDKKLPRIGAHVRTSHGSGKVINRQVLTQLVQIQDEEGKMMTVVVEDVLEIDGQTVPGRELPGPETRGEGRWEKRHRPQRSRDRSPGPSEQAPGGEQKKEGSSAQEPAPQHSSPTESKVDEGGKAEPGTSKRAGRPPRSRRRKGRRRPRRK
jgi:cell fate regulator YaaT (PSP1 superfamily)